jgi:hypothetical protein
MTWTAYQHGKQSFDAKGKINFADQNTKMAEDLEHNKS